MTPHERRHLQLAHWRRDCLIAAALLYAMHEDMSRGGDPAHQKSLRLMTARLDEIRRELR